MNKNALIFIGCMILANIIVWLQINGQLVWSVLRNNTLLLSLLGMPLSFLFIYGTRYGYAGFEKLWTVRMVGFSVGTIISVS